MPYKDPAKQREYQRKWARENKDKQRKAVTKWRANAKSMVDARAEAGCYACGEKDRACMDFHHYRGVKKFDIGYQSKWPSYSGLAAELDKTIVVCANCHRRIHAILRQINAA